MFSVGLMFKQSLRGVVDAFLEGKRAGTPTLQTNGEEIWSYGVPIARRTEGAVVMLLDRWWSTTTSRHEHLVRRIARAEGFVVVPVNGAGKEDQYVD